MILQARNPGTLDVDVEIAERIFGVNVGWTTGYNSDSHPYNKKSGEFLPFYCSEMDLAFEIVEHVIAVDYGYEFSLTFSNNPYEPAGWKASFVAQGIYEAAGASAGEAICRAALKVTARG